MSTSPAGAAGTPHPPSAVPAARIANENTRFSLGFACKRIAGDDNRQRGNCRIEATMDDRRRATDDGRQTTDAWAGRRTKAFLDGRCLVCRLLCTPAGRMARMSGIEAEGPRWLGRLVYGGLVAAVAGVSLLALGLAQGWADPPRAGPLRWENDFKAGDGGWTLMAPPDGRLAP